MCLYSVCSSNRPGINADVRTCVSTVLSVYDEESNRYSRGRGRRRAGLGLRELGLF